MISSEERKSILTKLNLKRTDIELLEGVQQRQANQIMSTCKKNFDGKVESRPNFITTLSYFKFCNAESEYNSYHKGENKNDGGN